MINGISDRRAAVLRDLVGVSKRTLERWRRWWRDVFAQSGLWRAERGRLAVSVDSSRLPASLLECFGESDNQQGALAALKFLSGLTDGAGWPMEV
jgi:hypothetical protein